MSSLLKAVIPRSAWLYLHFVGKTSRVFWRNLEARAQIERSRGAFIFAFWHGRQALLAWAHRNRPYSTLVSQSKDGEYIARVISLFGMGTVRGSSSRGGAKALIQLKKEIESGRTLGFTPDGPKGPQRKVAPGVLYLARKTGKPILPITCSARRKLIFKGWDDYWFPLPFNRILIHHGNPVSVGPDDDLERKAAELAAELDRITQEADAFCAAASLSEAMTRGLPHDNPWPVVPGMFPPPPGFREKIFYFFYNLCGAALTPVIALLLFLRYPATFTRHFLDGLAQRFGFLRLDPLPDGARPVWIHAASLGEARAAAPLVKALKEKHPSIPVFFSSTTPNGIREARRLALGDKLFYAPLDFPFALKRAFRSVRPRLLLLLESEIWPNLLEVCRREGVRAGIVNGRISQRSAGRYLRMAAVSRMLAAKLGFVCAREEADAGRFRAIGVAEGKITVTGNMKFDFLPWNAAETAAESVPPPELVWTAGSVREGEEDIILEVFAALKKERSDLQLILAPRHLEKLEALKERISASGFGHALVSRPDWRQSRWDILLWDTFGDLWQAYRAAAVVFVGGSLTGKGGQNPIEPAHFAKPVLFGPSMENFQEPARLLIAAGGALEVKNAAELRSRMGELLSDPARRKAMGESARSAVARLQGEATRRTLAVLAPYLND